VEVDLPLFAHGPHPDLAGVDLLFEPFIGSWDLEVTWFEGLEPTRTEAGEWHFAWVLEGRAVQDVWIVPRRDQRRAGADLYEYGTSIRFPDPGLGGWRSTWLGPTQRSVRTFAARRIGDDVVLDGEHDDGTPLRWAFSDIAPDSFSWSNATGRPDGTWLVTQRFRATRSAHLVEHEDRAGGADLGQ
jgi:hypothetical protein